MKKTTSQMATMPVGTPQPMNLPSNFRKKGAGGAKGMKKSKKRTGGGPAQLQGY